MNSSKGLEKLVPAYKPSLERLMHEYNQVWRLTYLTPFGVRVYFFELLKNRWGRAGTLTLATSEAKYRLMGEGMLVIDEVAPQ